MATATDIEPVVDFYRYPPVGDEDWRYAYPAAKVRALETTMLSRAVLSDMANAADFGIAVEALSSGEYAVSPQATDLELEQMLLGRRTAVRELFAELMIDAEIADMMRAREDFANMRLAVRRLVTERPIGLDYSNEGSVSAEQFEEILEQENYDLLPEHLQDAVEAAVLGYYENKDIRRIDYGIDRVEAAWRIRRAMEIESEFCLSYARILVDLTNIRTMLRLKLAERDEKGFFLPGGFVDTDKFATGLAAGLENTASIFYATPYYEMLEEGVRYLRTEQSFLKLEQQCEDYVMGFMKSSRQIAAGPQPVIAYFLMKEAEIRAVRMVLVGKKAGLSPRLMLDRLGTWHG